MLRAFRFVLLTIVVLVVVWYVATLPGEIQIVIGETEIKATTPVAVFCLVTLDVFLLLMIGVIRFFWQTPGRVAVRRAVRRREAGMHAAVRALAALAAGDLKSASEHARIAQRHTPDEPLSLYVAGEAARQAGDHRAADTHFSTLATHKEVGFLGWHGLLSHHANDAHDGSSAVTAADLRAAVSSYPTSAWLREQRMRIAASQGDYAQAARLADNRAERAALAIMASRDAQRANLAVDWARHAVRANPESAVTWLQLALAHQRAQWPQAWHRHRARIALRNGWKLAPHPDIASAFLKDIDAPLDRARAAQSLAALNPNSPESAKLLAETAHAAQLEGEARRHAAAAQAAGTQWICSSCEAEVRDWRYDCPRCGAIGALVWSRKGDINATETAAAADVHSQQMPKILAPP